ncbi:MAG: glycosyltransferase family 4 protein [Syntrophaceae bacterium]|nr:glycosyltransferase family 4 protein [Syntrophaceae bacterium]
MKVLFIVNECNPEWASVPLLGYQFFDGISRLSDVTLVTHERNKCNLEKVRDGRDICYISENRYFSKYYKMINRLILRRGVNWPLHHSLTYPLYWEFNNKVYNLFCKRVQRGEYSVVHVMTPILPRYSYKIVNACEQTPFVVGPVNGGLPFPESFGDVATKEHSKYNFLRGFSRCHPGYRKTYRSADMVLAGSSYTYKYLKELFSLESSRLRIFFENGILKEFISPGSFRKTSPENEPIRLLFVGRLVPYKGADMILSALHHLNSRKGRKATLTIVGDGQEKANLKNQAAVLHLNDVVHFTGWVDQKATLEYYRQSDIFCFPSIREFGGAVVLEALATGLPCIITNYGGISEYVTDETGFKIDPKSREHIVAKLAEIIQMLADNPAIRRKLSENAVSHAECFEWGNKAKQMVSLYQSLV